MEPVDEPGELLPLGSPAILGGVLMLEEGIVEGWCKTEECETCKQFDKMNIKIVTVLRIEGK